MNTSAAASADKIANISVVTCNRLELTKICLESLCARTKGEFRLHVVDNKSSDKTLSYLEGLAARCARVRVLPLAENYGPALAANTGWAAMRADYYVKVDNDIRILDDEWLLKLMDIVDRNPEVGMVGYRLLDWPHKNEAVNLSGGDSFIASETCNGGCALIPRRTFEELGFWNEDYGKYGFTDCDYSLRVRLKKLLAGYPSLECLEAEHLGFAPDFTDGGHEERKKAHLDKKYRGEQLFVLNTLLFEQGIRPLYVPRKHFSLQTPEGLKFKASPESLALGRLQSQVKRRMAYSDENGKIRVDLSEFKK